MCKIKINGTDGRPANWMQSQIPIYRHCTAASPYCRATLRVSLSRIQSSVPQQWHRRDRLPTRDNAMNYGLNFPASMLC